MIRDTTALPATAPAAERPTQRPAPEARAATPDAPAIPVPNPSLRLDAALNLVVIEFRGAKGEVEATIPSPRELDAYRTSERASETPPRLDVEG